MAGDHQFDREIAEHLVWIARSGRLGRMDAVGSAGPVPGRTGGRNAV